MSVDEELRWLWLTTLAALHLWDDEPWHVLSDRYVELARRAGALSELPLALSTRAIMLLFAGDLTAATSLVDEQRAVTEATGGNLAPYSAMALAALAGRKDEALSLIETTISDVGRAGRRHRDSRRPVDRAVLHNGLGDYPEAVAAAQEALRYQRYPEARYPGVAHWAAAELIEAAARSGTTEVATEAVTGIEEMTSASRTTWALGLEARSRALISDRSARRRSSRGDRSARPHPRPHRPRPNPAALRRVASSPRSTPRRPWAAPRGLRDADEDRGGGVRRAARLELVATGETACKRTVTTIDQLTAREAQVARMACDGLSNPEIGYSVVPEPAHGRVPPGTRLRQTRHHVAPRAGRRPRRCPVITASHEPGSPADARAPSPSRARANAAVRRDVQDPGGCCGGVGKDVAGPVTAILALLGGAQHRDRTQVRGSWRSARTSPSPVASGSATLTPASAST